MANKVLMPRSNGTPSFDTGGATTRPNGSGTGFTPGESGGYGGAIRSADRPSEDQIMQQQLAPLISVLNSPSATPQQKAVAAQQLVRYHHANAAMSGTMQHILMNAGWRMNGDQLEYIADGSPRPLAMSIPGEGDANQWQTTMRQLGAQQGQAQARQAGAPNTTLPGGAMGGGQIQASNSQPHAIDPMGAFGGTTNLGSAPADPSQMGSGRDYSGTFFGGVQNQALDALAGDPDAAWGVFRTRGGPGGGSLANSTAAQYGENDFKSAMQLAPLLGQGLGTGGDTLGFADSMMQRGMQSGGNYVDPAKVLQSAFANIGNDPSLQNQERGIQTALQAVEPYMDPTQYRMLQNRIGSVLDEYMTYGLENGTADLNGELLQRVMQAIGM